MTQSAADTESARALFDRLLSLSREAHESRLHEVAYHALSAAMHAAQTGGDVAGVAAIADEARQQIHWIDTNVPSHRLSTRSAMKHDHPGVYAMLERQGEMVVRMLERVEGSG